MTELILTKELSKAARGLVGLSASGLAKEASVSLDTIKSFESGRTKTLSATNQDAVMTALEKAGVHFIPENGGGAGVRLRERS